MILESKKKEENKKKHPRCESEGDSKGEMTGVSNIYGLQGVEDFLSCHTSVNLLPPCLHFQTSDGFRNKTKQNKKCYVQVSFSSVFDFFFFLSSVLLFVTVQASLTHTPVYRALKHTNSYLQIYLVKTLININSIFKTNLATN